MPITGRKRILEAVPKYWPVVNCKVRTAHSAVMSDTQRKHIPR